MFAIAFCAKSLAYSQESLSGPLLTAAEIQAKVVEQLGKDPIIVKAVEAQNAKKIPLPEIQQIDKEWCNNQGLDARMKELMSSACGTHLKNFIKNRPIYIEVFAMDNHGALVAMTNKTSDYWQGDEKKWQRSFNEGKGKTFIDNPYYDSSTRTVLLQISAPVRNATGKTIGAITAGININILKSSIR